MRMSDPCCGCEHYGSRNAFVSDLEKRQGCAALQGRDGRGGLDRACHTKPGPIAYECSSCSYVTSVLTPSAGSKERWQ
jgi:hypothetical protein